MGSLLPDPLHDWWVDLLTGTGALTFALAGEVTGVFPPALIVLHGVAGGLFVALAAYSWVNEPATPAES